MTCSAMGWEPDMEALSGAVGELNPNVEAQIVDDNEKEVPIGERGELWVRGPNICVGYWRKPEETDKTFAPGRWLKTGDIAYRNEDGFLWIVDRKKEVRIIVCSDSELRLIDRHSSSKSRACKWRRRS